MRGGSTRRGGGARSTGKATEEVVFDQGSRGESVGLPGGGRGDTAGGWKAVGEGSLFRMPFKD